MRLAPKRLRRPRGAGGYAAGQAYGVPLFSFFSTHKLHRFGTILTQNHQQSSIAQEEPQTPEINPKQVIETKAGDVPPRVPSNLPQLAASMAPAAPSRTAAPAPVQEEEAKDDGALVQDV